MKKICCLIAVVLMVVFTATIALMVEFKTPIRIDLTNKVQLLTEDQPPILPWYLRIGVTYDGKLTGLDGTGQRCTMFMYSLPEIFESAEIECFVCWDTNEVVAFVGESRAMDIIEEPFPTVRWK